jgi:hypothetical protein
MLSRSQTRFKKVLKGKVLIFGVRFSLHELRGMKKKISATWEQEILAHFKANARRVRRLTTEQLNTIEMW